MAITKFLDYFSVWDSEVKELIHQLYPLKPDAHFEMLNWVYGEGALHFQLGEVLALGQETQFLNANHLGSSHFTASSIMSMQVQGFMKMIEAFKEQFASQNTKLKEGIDKSSKHFLGRVVSEHSDFYEVLAKVNNELYAEKAKHHLSVDEAFVFSQSRLLTYKNENHKLSLAIDHCIHFNSNVRTYMKKAEQQIEKASKKTLLPANVTLFQSMPSPPNKMPMQTPSLQPLVPIKVVV